MRAYLDGEGFLEVETPILQPRYGGGFAEPFVTHSNELDTDLYLRIADELYLKRLIVGGLEKVYELAKDFRNESISYKHSPEFTQVEWYEAYADYRDTMERTEALVERAALGAIGTTQGDASAGTSIDLARPWRRVKFVEALEEHGVWSRDADELRAKLNEAGVDTDRGHDVDAARRPRVLALRRAGADPADDRLRLAARDVAVRADDRRRRDDRRALRVRRRRDGVRERVQRAERQRGAGGALRDAGGGARRPATRRRSPAIRTSSRRSRTACRRPAAAASGSTGSRWC